jgi:hypothetical protein
VQLSLAIISMQLDYLQIIAATRFHDLPLSPRAVKLDLKYR